MKVTDFESLPEVFVAVIVTTFAPTIRFKFIAKAFVEALYVNAIEGEPLTESAICDDDVTLNTFAVRDEIALTEV
jgi:hypothetical protein